MHRTTTNHHRILCTKHIFPSRRHLLLAPLGWIAAANIGEAQAYEVRLVPLEEVQRDVTFWNNFDQVLDDQETRTYVSEELPDLAEELRHTDPEVIDGLYEVLQAIPRDVREGKSKRLRPYQRMRIRNALLAVMQTPGVSPTIYLWCQQYMYQPRLALL